MYLSMLLGKLSGPTACDRVVETAYCSSRNVISELYKSEVLMSMGCIVELGIIIYLLHTCLAVQIFRPKNLYGQQKSV